MIWTHNLSVMRCVLYRCATTAASSCNMQTNISCWNNAAGFFLLLGKRPAPAPAFVIKGLTDFHRKSVSFIIHRTKKEQKTLQSKKKTLHKFISIGTGRSNFCCFCSKLTMSLFDQDNFSLKWSLGLWRAEDVTHSPNLTTGLLNHHLLEYCQPWSLPYVY